MPTPAHLEAVQPLSDKLYEEVGSEMVELSRHRFVQGLLWRSRQSLPVHPVQDIKFQYIIGKTAVIELPFHQVSVAIAGGTLERVLSNLLGCILGKSQRFEMHSREAWLICRWCAAIRAAICLELNHSLKAL